MAGEDTQGSIAWPVKRRELVKFVVDSRKWNNFQMRDGDIVICTWSKAGTNWLQQVVGQLVFGGAEGIFGSDVCNYPPPCGGLGSLNPWGYGPW